MLERKATPTERQQGLDLADYLLRFDYQKFIDEQQLRKTSTYKGKVTKRAVRVQKLEIKQWEADELRWSFESMPVSLQKALGKNFKF